MKTIIWDVGDSPVNAAMAEATGNSSYADTTPWNQSRLTLADALDILTGLVQ